MNTQKNVTLLADPFDQFQEWFELATQVQAQHPEAMTLATSTSDGQPRARIVLFKGINSNRFMFFTNYTSKKGQELEQNPKAALLFHWLPLARQIRIEGVIEKLSEDESDLYWEGRPRESQLGAYASEQSSVIPNREHLERLYFEYQKRFEGQKIPRPSHWGGYGLAPKSFEFWMEGAHRLHDRFLYTAAGTHSWRRVRLSP
jgi:pyridoxamine 5'-phosphate oxidase